MASTASTYEGEWRKLGNLSADREGSIHDDNTARSMGFQGGFVPGSTVGTSAIPAIIDRYGKEWFTGGWYTFKFVTPVYVHEDVREASLPVEGSGDITIGVVTREDRTCMLGRAGLGEDLGPTGAWDPALDGVRGAGDCFPRLTIGEHGSSEVFTPVIDEIVPLLDSAGDTNGWFRTASPFGAALIAPEYLMRLALQLSRESLSLAEGVRNPGMWAEHSLVMAQPIFLGDTFRMTSRLADKGRSSRTLFVEYEFEVFDANNERRAVGRQKVKWFAADAPTGDR